MKKVWLMGGFGNVLFQILAYNIIKEKSEKVYFIEKLTEKNFITKIIKWTTHQKLYRNLIPTSQVMEVGAIHTILALFVGVCSKFSSKYFPFATFYISKLNIDNAELAQNIFGYFQEKEFLNNHKEEILSLGHKIKKTYGVTANYEVVVHYRKGDSGWATLHSGYYDEVKNLLKKENKEISIVTDSPSDATSFFKEVNRVQVINSNDAIEDFKILMGAKKLYCAPSTFSWWAAHTLSENCSVVAPKFLDDDLGMYLNCPLYLF